MAGQTPDRRRLREETTGKGTDFMTDVPVIPELKTILGALIFGANRPLKTSELRKCVVETAREHGGEIAAFAEVTEGDVKNALDELRADMERGHGGFVLREVAGGARFESDPACGRWLRNLLELGKPNRLSRPALETLAIIAYRQPITKVTIEGIRGVQADHIMKMLMELQLVRIVGRSDLPGRPFLYGTTQTFLEHFGLRGLDDLNEIEPMLLKEMMESSNPPAPAAEAAAEAPAPSAEEDVPPELPPADDKAADGKGEEEAEEEEEEYDDEDEYEDDEEDDDDEESEDADAEEEK